MTRKRVAVVGSGCSGLGALWALATSTDHDVHLYEADTVLGGHTNTVCFKHEDKEVNVDTGFIVFNTATYPNFIKFLEAIKVETVPTEMTFSVSRDSGAFEWAGTSLRSVFAQTGNMFSPRMWRMIFDIWRFNNFALDLLQHEDEGIEDPSGSNGASKEQKVRKSKAPSPRAQETIGEYLYKEGYSIEFRDDYLIPMTAAVWSTSPDRDALEFPAITLIRFMWNHHLLSTVALRPLWKTIPGGAKKYIDAVVKDIPKEKVHLSCGVTSLEDINGKVILQFENDEEELFDHVILACHGDQIREIIRDSATDEEMSVLGGFRSTENIAYLHSDRALLPKRPVTWSSWNLLTTTRSPLTSKRPTQQKVCLTYNMNILQHIPRDTYGDVLVTLNPPKPKVAPAQDTVQGRWVYRHPLYTPRTIRAQKLLPRIQNTRSISYAGAWTRYGFHEDGFSSGVKVAMEHLGAAVPWKFEDATFARGKRPRRGVGDWMARALIMFLRVLIRVFEWAWDWVVWWVWPFVWFLRGGGQAGGEENGSPPADERAEEGIQEDIKGKRKGG